MIVMALAAGSGAIYLAVGMPWEAQVLLLVAAVLTILYAVPFVKIYGKRLSLRSAGYFKVFIISTVWALVTSFIPSGSFMLMLERFLFIFPLALVFDISDMEYDRNAGLLTFPTRFGVRTTKRIALGVLYLSAGVTLWNHSDPTIILPTLYSVALAIPVILLVNEQRKDWYFLVLVDGLITVQGLLLIWADWSP